MILKVRNKNGEWVSIGSVQGEKGADGTMSFEDLTEEQKASLKGEDYILTEEDKQEIAGMVEVPEVDLKNYYTKSEVDNLISAIPTYSDGDEVNY